jgi:hypothetical protein
MLFFRNRLSFATDEERICTVFIIFSLSSTRRIYVCLRTRREESRRIETLGEGDPCVRYPRRCVFVRVFKNRKAADSTPWCDMLSRAYSCLSLLLTAFYSNQHAKWRKSLNYAHSFFSIRGLFGILLFLIGRETRPRHNGVSYFAGSRKQTLLFRFCKGIIKVFITHVNVAFQIFLDRFHVNSVVIFL